jgi:hypothetical protein
MARRKQATPTLEEIHPDWTISYEIKHNGRIIEKDTELSIKGESGRFLFIKHVQTPTAEWIDVIGGKNGKYKQFRSFHSDRIKRVHYKNKTRENLTS